MSLYRRLSVFPKRKEEDGTPKVPNEMEIKVLSDDKDMVKEIRTRLSSVSWFMRCLNEPIARRANKEDNCTGRFWEGRFKCQVLLDEAAYITAMAYVDLNPIRAGIVETPEESAFTSVKDRIDTRQARENLNRIASENTNTLTPKQRDYIELEKIMAEADQWLGPIDSESTTGQLGILPLSTDQYIDLIDWTGRRIIEGKKGAIPDHLSAILIRLDIETDHWLNTVQSYGSVFHRAVGKLTSMTASAGRAGKRWWQGLNACRTAFSTS